MLLLDTHAAVGIFMQSNNPVTETSLNDASLNPILTGDRNNFFELGREDQSQLELLELGKRVEQ